MAVPGVILALLATALSVDIGRQVFEKRSNQSVADLASLDAARVVSKLPTTASSSLKQTTAQNEAVTSAARNQFVSSPTSPVVATVGSLDPVTKVFSATGSSVVLVTVTSSIDYIFAPMSKTLTARAVAGVSTADAEFSAGSTLVGLNLQKSRLDPILATMLGLGSTDLNLVSYDGLATANVTLAGLQAELLAMGLDVGTPDKLMNTDITAAQLFKATAQALTKGGNSAAAAEVNKIPIASIPNTKKVKLGRLVDISQPASDSALGTNVNIFSLLTSSTQLANGSSFVDVPLTGIAVPGIGGVTMKLNVIEPPRSRRGPVGTQAKTSQVTLRVTANIGLGPLLPVAAVTLDYTAASAVATLLEINCTTAPGIRLSAGTNGFSVVGSAVVPLGTMNILGSVAGTPTTTLPFFDYPARFTPYKERIGAASLGLNLASVNVTGSGAVSLVLVPALQLALPVALTTLNTALSPVIQPLLASLGANIAAADVQALAIYPSPTNCLAPPKLVQ